MNAFIKADDASEHDDQETLPKEGTLTVIAVVPVVAVEDEDEDEETDKFGAFAF